MRRTAFTLTELLVVIGLILLIVILALPVFSAMTGTRSIDAAANQLSAVIGRARNEAIGLQQAAGVLFFLDPETDRVNCAMVRELNDPTAPSGVVYLDVTSNRDFVTLPAGVGVQVIDNCLLSSGERQDNAYIGFNSACNEAGNPLVGTTPEETLFGGVILFDANGRLIANEYRFKLRLNSTPTEFYNLITRHVSVTLNDNPVTVQGDWTTNTADVPKQSAFGFVLYDRELFKAANHGEADPDRSDYTSGSEDDEEGWIDENAIPFLVNRYNGTLIQGQ